MTNSAIDPKEEAEAEAKEEDLRARLRASPGSGRLNFELARLLTESGRRGEALQFIEQACKIAPREFQYLYYCGALYKDFRQFDLALELLKASVGVEPRVFLSQYDLADCYYLLGQGDKAEGHYRTAVKLASTPHERELGQTGLAKCLANSGLVDEAISLYEDCSTGTSELAIYALCQGAVLRKAGPGDPAEQSLLDLIKQDELSLVSREEVLLTLGKMHDIAGNHDQAFGYWQQSRAIALELAKEKRQTVFNDHAAFLKRRVEFFTPELVGRLASYGHQSEAPVFVPGMPRSGTTLTEQILGSHPQVAGVGEIARWRKIEAAFLNDYDGADYHVRLLANAAKGELIARAEEDLTLMKTTAGGNYPRFVEKTPHMFEWLGYFATCFAKARFLHLVRHPADTFISTYQNKFNRNLAFAYDQVEFAREYAFSIRIMNFWKSLYPDRIDTYFYESLVDNTEHEARRMVAFIGLQWDENCLRFHERQSVVRTFSAQQVKKPIYKSSLGKWRAYEKHLGPLFAELDRQGVTYEPGRVTVNA
jgi:tetratricopeptide (TPR) repeat protein